MARSLRNDGGVSATSRGEESSANVTITSSTIFGNSGAGVAATPIIKVQSFSSADINSPAHDVQQSQVMDQEHLVDAVLWRW